jgi:hypothetical protein
MKRNLLTSIWVGLLLCAAGIMTAQAAITNAYITFSVDMSSNLVAGTFNPATPAIIGGNSYGGTGTDTVYARGIFNGWANTGLQLVQVGASGVYTNTADDTAAQDLSDGNANWQYDAYLNGTLTDEGTSDYANRMAYLPTTNNGTVVVPTAFFNDSGPLTTNNITYQVDMSEQIEVGAFHPGSGDYVVVAGSYDNFVLGSSVPPQVMLTNNPNILITNNNFSPPVIESNVWVGTAAISTDSSRAQATVNCGQQYKYVIEPGGSWDAPQFPNLDPDGGNRFLTMSGDQILPLVNFSDQPYAPLANVTLNLDMSGPITYDTNFVPGSVVVWGTFNGWATGIPLTNNPAAPNTNLYSTVISMEEGAPIIVQYRYTNSFINYFVYDYAQDGGPNSANNNNYRRTVTLPITPSLLVTNLPAVYFDDLAPDDYLTKPTPVLFSVDMNGAVGTDAHVFNPSADGVYINGSFAGATPSEPNGGTPQEWYPWSGASPVAAPPGYQMVEVGTSTIYTNTIVLPVGTPVALSYQYGMDPSSFSLGPSEDEAAVQTVHYRAVRSTGFNPYVMPVDIFTNQPYVEPFFSTGNIGANGNLAGGDLTVGTPVAGKVPVSWLGRPGAHLQSKASLVSGVWQDAFATDGTNWTAGVSSTNGFVSVTNWPSGGNTFFRLVKP